MRYGKKTNQTNLLDKDHFSLCMPQNGQKIPGLAFSYNLFRYSLAVPQ
jgi:hypothetical protein